jgi:hypothetical protein
VIFVGQKYVDIIYSVDDDSWRSTRFRPIKRSKMPWHGSKFVSSLEAHARRMVELLDEGAEDPLPESDVRLTDSPHPILLEACGKRYRRILPTPPGSPEVWQKQLKGLLDRSLANSDFHFLALTPLRSSYSLDLWLSSAIPPGTALQIAKKLAKLPYPTSLHLVAGKGSVTRHRFASGKDAARWLRGWAAATVRNTATASVARRLPIDSTMPSCFVAALLTWNWEAGLWSKCALRRLELAQSLVSGLLVAKSGAGHARIIRVGEAVPFQAPPGTLLANLTRGRLGSEEEARIWSAVRRSEPVRDSLILANDPKPYDRLILPFRDEDGWYVLCLWSAEKDAEAGGIGDAPVRAQGWSMHPPVGLLC